MKCQYCGSDIPEGIMMCNNCGGIVTEDNHINLQNSENNIQNNAVERIKQIDLKSKKEYEKIDKASFLTCIVSLIPLFGIIIFFVNRKDYPKKAKTSLICAAIGIIAYFLMFIILGIVSMFIN